MEQQAFMELLFKKAKEQGFEAYEAHVIGGESFKVTAEKGKIDEYKVSAIRGLGFRGMRNGRMGYAYTEVFDEAAAAMVAQKAWENAGLIDTDDPQFIYEGGGEYQTVEGWSQAIEAFSPEAKIALAIEMEEAARVESPWVKSVRPSMALAASHTVTLRNSKGLNLGHRCNSLLSYVCAIIEKDGVMTDGDAYIAARNPGEIDGKALAREAVQKALAKLNASPVASGKYPVLLDREAAMDLLGTYSGIFSGESAQKGLSLLQGRVGETIASPTVTLVDDPWLAGSAASAPFDGEGVPTQRKNIIDGGKLTTLLHNLKTAAKEGCPSTGNAQKPSYKSSVGIDAFNLFFAPGSRSPEQMMHETGKGLLITELEGLHAGADTVSGDFSLAAKGYLIEGGQKSRPVEQITIAGNFYALLKDIVAVGNDLRMAPGGGVGSPTVWVRELSVAGE